jgi:hypothetical protein
MYTCTKTNKPRNKKSIRNSLSEFADFSIISVISLSENSTDAYDGTPTYGKGGGRFSWKVSISYISHTTIHDAYKVSGAV